MKYIFSFIILTAIFSFNYIEDIYNIPLTAIDGEKIDLNHFKGKKMLFMVLPVSATDTTVSVQELSALQTKYESSLIIIGIAAEEAGFNKADVAGLKKLYGGQKQNFILTEGMKVKKGAEQSALFQWLTNKDKNHHFDQDVQGAGQKFFVDEQGELYAVFGPRLKLSHPVIERVLSRPSKN